MNIDNYNYLSNFSDILYIYNNFDKVKEFINKYNNNNIMDNINKFITLFKNYEQS